MFVAIGISGLFWLLRFCCFLPMDGWILKGKAGQRKDGVQNRKRSSDKYEKKMLWTVQNGES